MNQFLPISKKEVSNKGWNELDIILITGDAYVDHPSFGAAVIGRILENGGYRVGIISMPDWRNKSSISHLGKPRLFYGVTSGNVDSMIARYTAFKKRRNDDPYAPNGKAGSKPDRALIVYCNLIKSMYKDVPIVIGGIEASMRRIAHYDYWSDSVRRSIIEDTRADILVYGMGEKAILQIAQRLSSKKSLQGIEGTVVINREIPDNVKFLPSEENVIKSHKSFIEFYKQFYQNQHKILAQPANKRYIIHNPPAIIDSNELDKIYNLPFIRAPHPEYTQPIPAFDMICNSVTSHRGCFSGCSFCSLGLHQGKRIVSRSTNSIIKEVKHITTKSYFKGQITDIGGPSANMYGFNCRKNWNCIRESCTFPRVCSNLQFSTAQWIKLLQQAESFKNIKKVTVGSGIRYDILLYDLQKTGLLKKLIENHISGQLKIAPEHTDSKVLRAMRKIPLIPLNDAVKTFQSITQNNKSKQHLLPYLMSNHPGCNFETMKSMKKKILSLFHFVPQQVQSFIPLPMTLSSVIYYTGVDPLTNEKFKSVIDLGKKRKNHQVFFQKQKLSSHKNRRT